MTSTTDWVAVDGATDLPPDRLERVLRVGQISTPELTDEERRGPQAYLVAQGSATEPLAVHFHTVDQFQYFAHGEGVVGSHGVHHGTVHYSDALTPYGPLKPGAAGMSYLTLRSRHDGGAHFMPDSATSLRERLAGSGRSARDRRNVTVELDGALDPARWHHLADHADGLRISVVDVPAGEEGEPLVVGGGGAYAVVVTGSVVSAGERFEPAALRWFEPGDVIEGSRGGPDGVRIAVLQYPEPRHPAAG